MPVIERSCYWPGCDAQAFLKPVIGLSGICWHCPVHHEVVKNLLHKDVRSHMPVSEREAPMLADAQRYPFIANCDQPSCWFIVSAKTYEEGVAALTSHTCPHTGGPTRTGLLVSRTIIENAWIKLDACVASLMEDNLTPEDKQQTKYICRGMAEVLALFMSPYFTTGDEVAAEASARYKAKKAGEDHETPGLRPVKLSPPPQTSTTKYAGPAPVKKLTHKLGDKEVSAIKFAMQSGMFKAPDLAKTYGVSAAVIEEICAG